MIPLSDARHLLDAAARVGDWLVRAVLSLRQPGEQAAARALAHALALAEAAQALTRDFTVPMSELALLRVDWPHERRAALAHQVAAFALGHQRMDAVRHAVAGLNAAERSSLPAEALPEIDALVAGGERLIDTLGQLASPFHHAQALAEFLDALLDGPDDAAAQALRQRAHDELDFLQGQVRDADTLAPVARLAEVLARAHPRVAAVAWPVATPVGRPATAGSHQPGASASKAAS